MNTRWLLGHMILALAVLVNSDLVSADVLVFCLDTSGSMNELRKIEAAKAGLIQQIEQAQPGDAISAIAFDTNDYAIGQAEIGEDGSPELKKGLIAKVAALKARGKFTNIDECVDAARSSLVFDRSPNAGGARKIIVLTDGISDPSPDHRRMDLRAISEMIPQEPGWGLYIVGLPADIAGFFQSDPQESGIVTNPENERIVGIPVREFSREAIKAAVATVKEDSVGPTPNPSSTAEPSPSSTPPSTPTSTLTALPAPFGTPGGASLVPWLGASLALVAIPLALIWLRRTPADLKRFVVEVREDSAEAKSCPVAFGEGMQKTVGTRGEVPLSDPDLPAVVCTFQWRSGRMWLSPQDTIAVNGQPITNKTVIDVGDVISIRQRVTLTINEPEEDE